MSPQTLGILVTLALLCAAGAVLLGIGLVRGARQRERLVERVAPLLIDAGDVGSDDRSRLLERMAKGGRAIEGWVDPDNESARLMSQAGWRSTEARVAWYAFQGLIPLAGVLVVAAYWWLGDDPKKSLYLPLLGFVAFALSVLIPRWVLRQAAARRQARVKAEVPLFVHLLVLLFDAGLSTRQALSSMVREGGGVLPELGHEFAILLRSLDAGADTGEVLKNLADLLQVDDLGNILAVLRQVDRFGGEVREPLLEALAVMEQNRSLELREEVNLMSGRMTVVMVLFFFPALLIFVAGPAFLSVIKALNDVAG
ncbi:type II secretion system F family protein [Flagellatimonas centrodinii]|uniref:type II secretion system F family protein n=1 Tax=Flagellatimonas centrodinii TaxID=2806210 RepID=UPI001FEF8E6B|nr:type II secretion system F family protein [Flagellatimonas centrodinii]ULQ45354.1 type II secretion system F family protein [Flagellatimonas centrodinii]